MKTSTKRGSPRVKGAPRASRSKAVSAPKPAPKVTEKQVAHALAFVTEDVAPAVQDALNAAGFEVAPLRKEAIAKALAAAKSPCAVVWSDPANCLASAIKEGADIAQAIEGWRERAEDVLALVRKNRRKLTLIDADILSAPDTDPVWDVLSKRLDLPKDLLQPSSETKSPAALSLTVARLAVPQIDSLRELLEELRASGVSPLTEGVVLSNLGAAAAAFAALRSQQDDLALMAAQVGFQVEEAAESSEERGLLQSQVMLLTDEMQRLSNVETAFTAQRLAHDCDQEEMDLFREQVQIQDEEFQKVGKERASLQEQLRRLTQEVERLRAAQTALETRHREALHNKDQALAQTVQDLGEMATARNDLEAQNAKLVRDVEDLTTLLAMVYESTSWRVTAPLRGVKRLVSK
jgi:flagellar biosynthesis/type III secretory pathway chaperone